MQINRFAIALFLSSASAAEVTTAKKAPRKLSKKNNGNSNSNSNTASELSADQTGAIRSLHDKVDNAEVMQGYRAFRYIQNRRVLAEGEGHPAIKAVGTIMKALGESDPQDLFAVVKEVLRMGVWYFRPTTRWTEYSELTDEQKSIATEGLNYTKETWNTLDTNPIEASAFFYLSNEQKTAAKQLGFIGRTWDCDVNHYGDYTWSELEDYSLDAYWKTLGWTQLRWYNENAPATEDMDWSELTPEQQDAARELCYFLESWDGIPITEWTSDGPNPNNNNSGEISWSVVGTVLGCLGSTVSSAIVCSGLEATDEDSCKDYQDGCALAVDAAVGVCAVKPKSRPYILLGSGYYGRYRRRHL